MSGKLSTHVLDTYSGRPANRVPWALEYKTGMGDWVRLGEGLTNVDGRTDAALLEGEALLTGVYRIIFEVGAYFKSQGVCLTEPAFLDEVTIQIGLEAGGSYHVPLLTSPWSYSTYRGS